MCILKKYLKHETKTLCLAHKMKDQNVNLVENFNFAKKIIHSKFIWITFLTIGNRFAKILINRN